MWSRGLRATESIMRWPRLPLHWRSHNGSVEPGRAVLEARRTALSEEAEHEESECVERKESREGGSSGSRAGAGAGDVRGGAAKAAESEIL